MQHYFGEMAGWHLLTFFDYTSTRVMLATCQSLLFCLFFGPYFIKKLSQLNAGQPIREDNGFLLGELHKSKKNTPTMGGVLILASVLSSLVVWMDLTSPFTIILFLTAVIFGTLGGYDDYLKLRYKNSKGLSGKKKLIVQLLWASMVIAYLQGFLPESMEWLRPPVILEFAEGDSKNVLLSLQEYSSRIYVPFVKEPVFILTGAAGVILCAFLAFVIVGSSNAVNLTDGLDGLATGLCILAAGTLGVFAFLSNHAEIAAYLNILYVEGSGEIAVFLAAVCGACLGFLWFNCQPAQLFMGDVGSLSLGGVIGVSAVLLNREFLLGLVGGIFVVEALSVIVQVGSYKWRKKRVFLCAPLHHHFEYKGWKESKVVIRFWIIGILLSLLGLISLKLQ
ncbi:MAG: phospho-N-acetylmuramoyl-pentapeptide-transferase [Verrucomicrobia bacterium]|nr:phospho-N-acetylmuramoyl-pentapeptide-transferase [Verrucomicrobiota bacterium]